MPKNVPRFQAMSASQLTQSLKAEAHRLGFALVGVCRAVEPAGFSRFENWIDAGFAGEMSYLEERKSAYRHPDHVLDGVVSIMMLGMNYRTEDMKPAAEGSGRIARYAWGTADYHDLIHERLKALKQFASEQSGSTNLRGVVDTAPLLEREFAQLCGLGWFAKNTMLIHPQMGSWFFLAALLLDAELESDEPFSTQHCGTCTACLDACPTRAFPEPGVLDATRCISYLTIEHRSPIDPELRPLMDNWVFGCDICQEVCPWNRKSPEGTEPEFHPLPDQNPIQLRTLFELDDAAFRERFRKTPLWRPKRRGLLRNAAIVLGNQPHDENIACLKLGLNDDESLVRGAAAWALGRHRAAVSEPILRTRLSVESDLEVQAEIQQAMNQLQEDAERFVDWK